MTVIGLDVSTTRVGFAAVMATGQLLGYMSYKMDSSFSLERRARMFEERFREFIHFYPSTKVFIEEPMIYMKSKSTANTIYKLHTFTGMIRTIVDRLSAEPVLLNVNSIRKQVGIKIPRGITKKEKKRVVIDWVTEKYKGASKEFHWSTTKQGNPQPGTDDMADAIIVALAGLKQLDKTA